MPVPGSARPAGRAPASPRLAGLVMVTCSMRSAVTRRRSVVAAPSHGKSAATSMTMRLRYPAPASRWLPEIRGPSSTTMVYGSLADGRRAGLEPRPLVRSFPPSSRSRSVQVSQTRRAGPAASNSVRCWACGSHLTQSQSAHVLTAGEHRDLKVLRRVKGDQLCQYRAGHRPGDHPVAVQAQASETAQIHGHRHVLDHRVRPQETS